jgi:hypothetical protein
MSRGFAPELARPAHEGLDRVEKMGCRRLLSVLVCLGNRPKTLSGAVMGVVGGCCREISGGRVWAKPAVLASPLQPS